MALVQIILTFKFQSCLYLVCYPFSVKNDAPKINQGYAKLNWPIYRENFLISRLGAVRNGYYLYLKAKTHFTKNICLFKNTCSTINQTLKSNS